MNWLVFHIASGHSFFSGVILIVLAVLASVSKRSILNRITVLVFLVGIIAIVLSSAAIPYWVYAVATVVTFAWIASRFHVSWRRWTAYLTIVVWLIAAMIEIPYHLTHSLDPTPNRKLTILGDSVSAGVGERESSETWPSIIARFGSSYKIRSPIYG
jgi:acyl-CoA thioesterase I